MKINEDLKNFYNSQAEKFHNTRKTHWPEFDRILSLIEWNEKNNLKILDLWCWDWRFLKFLEKKTFKQIDYEWVDISYKLIEIAQKQNKKWNFFVDSMENFLFKQNQQKYDFVLMNASFQHIPTSKERLYVLKQIYRVLDYYWGLVLVNWSFSKRFLKKHKKTLLKSVLKFIGSLWYYKINDLFLPWHSDKKEIYYRYYHIFFLSEIKNLIKETGFVIEYSGFTNKKWKISLDRKNSRNSFVYAKKGVTYKNQ